MIRIARATDATQLAEIYEPAVASATSFELVAPTPAEMATRLEATIPRYPWLVYESASKVAGYAYATEHRSRAAYRWSVDVSVYVDADFHRCGIGRSLYRSLLEVLRLQGFVTAHAGVALPNAASVGLHTALGFEQVGVFPNVGFKNGKWRDTAWFHLPIGQPVSEPAEPVGIDVLDVDDLAKALKIEKQTT